MKTMCAALLMLAPIRLLAAGAVVGEPGSCFIEIGIYTAHFTVYQPDSSGNEEFCEDLPEIGNTLFVLDYLHGSLDEVPVEFRIIRDVEDWGIFARWDNVRAIEDIDARTVFLQPGTIAGEKRLEVEHDFLEAGGYIGIVSAPHPSKDLAYHAVFPFQVARLNLLPWVMALAAVLSVGWYLWREQKS